jgi:hypothetical protein
MSERCTKYCHVDSCDSKVGFFGSCYSSIISIIKKRSFMYRKTGKLLSKFFRCWWKMAQFMNWFNALLGLVFVVSSSVAVHQSSELGKAGSDLFFLVA